MKMTAHFLFLASFLFQNPAFALTHMETAELLAKADLVAVGYTISVDQGVDSTTAQIQLVQVLKGRGEAPGGLLTVESPGGKVFVDESQPNFMTRQTNLLFLQKTPEGYACVNQADGQKVIRGDNIYPYHDNAAYSLPLKEYIEALNAFIKTAPALYTT